MQKTASSGPVFGVGHRRAPALLHVRRARARSHPRRTSATSGRSAARPRSTCASGTSTRTSACVAATTSSARSTRAAVSSATGQHLTERQRARVQRGPDDRHRLLLRPLDLGRRRLRRPVPVPAAPDRRAARRGHPGRRREATRRSAATALQRERLERGHPDLARRRTWASTSERARHPRRACRPLRGPSTRRPRRPLPPPSPLTIAPTCGQRISAAVAAANCSVVASLPGTLADVLSARSRLRRWLTASQITSGSSPTSRVLSSRTSVGDRKPPDHERHRDRRHEDLVGDGIERRTRRRHLPVAARVPSVEHVGEARRDEHRERGPRPTHDEGKHRSERQPGQAQKPRHPKQVPCAIDPHDGASPS